MPPSSLPDVMDDGAAIMEEMVGDNSLDDPAYILKGLNYISAIRPEEQPMYNKAKGAQVVVQSQVRPRARRRPPARSRALARGT